MFSLRLRAAYSGNTGSIFHSSTAEAIAYPDASFDFAISEYGASLWADPQRWVPDAACLLRPGGQLVFLTNSFLLSDGATASPGIRDVPS